MFWVIQENFKDEHNYDSLISALDRQGVRYQTVKMVPFGECTEPDIDPPNPVFVIGATSLSRVAAKKGWQPGYLDANLDQEILLRNYGPRMLNHGAVVCKLAEVEHKWDNFFIRPALDGKQFSGMCCTWEQFTEWRDRLVALNYEPNSFVSLKPDDRVLYGPTRGIHEEYRFFVVDGRVITGSRYKRGGRVHYDAHVDDYIRDWAQETADLWAPNKAFTLDVAVVEAPDDAPPRDALRVIEINAINSSGFYACDMGKFVAALEAAWA